MHYLLENAALTRKIAAGLLTIVWGSVFAVSVALTTLAYRNGQKPENVTLLLMLTSFVILFGVFGGLSAKITNMWLWCGVTLISGLWVFLGLISFNPVHIISGLVSLTVGFSNMALMFGLLVSSPETKLIKH